ncbi:uncharacterized protein [Palaemon carinicauda]|uniref:uncharacterized protein n=1 Tax=Palaemon carinicauda TaxID=392227 RepID=UPI0035B66EAC
MTSPFLLLHLLLLLSNPLRQVEADESVWHPVRIDETWFTQNSTHFGVHNALNDVVCAAVVSRKYWGNLFCFQEGSCRFSNVAVPPFFEETGSGNVIDCKALDPPRTCLPPYYPVMNVGCIMFLTATYTFSDARSQCQQQGGELATPKSFSALVQYMQMAVPGSAINQYWVGAQVSTGWYDGRAVNATDFAMDEPNGTGDCYRMKGPENLLMADQDCGVLYHVICEFQDL